MDQKENEFRIWKLLFGTSVFFALKMRLMNFLLHLLLGCQWVLMSKNNDFLGQLLFKCILTTSFKCILFFLTDKLFFFSFWAHFRIKFTFNVAGYSKKQSMFWSEKSRCFAASATSEQRKWSWFVGKVLRVFFFSLFSTKICCLLLRLVKPISWWKWLHLRHLRKKVLEKTQSAPLSVMKKLPASCCCGRWSNKQCREKIQDGSTACWIPLQLWLLVFCLLI